MRSHLISGDAMVLCEMCDGDVYLASRLNLNDLNGNNNSALMLRLFSYNINIAVIQTTRMLVYSKASGDEQQHERFSSTPVDVG